MTKRKPPTTVQTPAHVADVASHPFSTMDLKPFELAMRIVKAWRDGRSGSLKRQQSFERLCVRTGLSPVLTRAIVVAAYAIGQGDGVFTKHMQQSNSAKLAKKPQAKYKDVALKAYDELRAQGVGIVRAREDVAKTLKDKYGSKASTPSPSAIRDWVKERAKG